jgi:hypothetical protein
MRRPLLRRRPFLLVLLLCAASLLAGCADDPASPDPEPEPEPEAYPFADTEDKALVNFRVAYEAMDTDAYVDLVLYDEYHFVFVDGSPYAPAGGWDRGDEVQSVTSMFAGNAGYDVVTNQAKPGVQDISFNRLLRLNTWEDVPSSDPDFPGARKALFDVEIVFYQEDGQNTYTVAGQQLFYVMDAEETAGGVTRTHWRVYGQKDLTGWGKSPESMSWGSVKSLY